VINCFFWKSGEGGGGQIYLKQTFRPYIFDFFSAYPLVLVGARYSSPLNSRVELLTYTIKARDHTMEWVKSSPLAFGTLLLSIGLTYINLRQARRAKLPPGPFGVPLLGNIFSLPDKDEWKAYQDWGIQFSEPD
jgi:hypothetical protein